MPPCARRLLGSRLMHRDEWTQNWLRLGSGRGHTRRRAVPRWRKSRRWQFENDAPFVTDSRSYAIYPTILRCSECDPNAEELELSVANGVGNRTLLRRIP
jgi:hypothetical protein